MLTRELLLTVLEYCAQTGTFTWLVSQGRVAAGSRAGTLNGSGHVHVQLDGRKYPLARIAWLIAFGELPRVNIRHRNGNRADNRLCNLELATRVNRNKPRNTRAAGAGSGIGREQPRRDGVRPADL